MTILQQPDALSLSGNLKKLRIRSDSAVSLVLSTGVATLLEQSYEPNDDGLIEIDLREVVADCLSYDLRDTGNVYEQASLAATFTVVVSGTTITFRVVRGGVYKLQDSAVNFLAQNFLTWQPTQKKVSYYTPEFLTYYATVAATVKLKAYFTNSSGVVTGNTTITVASLSAGKAYTIPLQYSHVSGLLSNDLPAWYDVWVENGSGTRLSYVQRYIADSKKSLDEDWILWENSLGGLDTMRAYGSTELSFRHDHREAKVENESQEYHVDTDRLYKKDTGKLSKEEARWLLDFMPAKAKYIYLDSAIQGIVVTDSSVSGKVRTEPVSYSFTFKLSDTACLLNHARAEVPATVLDVVVPNLGNFTIAPRLAEFPSQTLSGGVLFPVQSPYSEGWGTATLDSIVNYFRQFGWINGDQLSSALSDAITNLRQYMEQAFRTGVISQSQAQAIEKYVNVIRTTLAQVEQDYRSVYGNRIFETTDDEDLLVARDLLTDAYTAYTEAATDLLDLISYVIADSEITQQEVDAINEQYEEYNLYYSNFCANLSNVQNMLIGSNAASIEALNNRFLRKANTNDTDPEGDTETLPITFVPKQTLQAGFRSIASFVPGVTGKGTDLSIVNTVDGDEITATDDIFTTDFVLARKRLQSSLGIMGEAEFGTFIDGGSGFVSDFTSEDGLTAVGRGAKIYSTGDIEGGTFTSRGNVVARGVQYADGNSVTYLNGTGEVIGYNALQAGRYFTPGAAGGGIRLNASGYGELSQLALRQHLVNSGVFADGFFGEGFKVWNDGGTWKMTIDQLTVRQTMNVYELLVNRIRAVGGMLVVSPASGKVKSVESDGDFWAIRFESGGDSFELHDLIRMQRFTGEDYVHGGEGQMVKGYWVEVQRTEFNTVTNHDDGVSIEQTEQTVWVRKDDIGLWAMPAPGDDVVQMGNTRNAARQSVIALTANESTVSDGDGGQVGTPTIDILTGIDRRNFSGTSRTRLGYVGDITDTAFYNVTTGVVESPQGYGLYSDNAYLKGRFVLANGTDVYTMFNIQSGLFESAIGNVSSSVMTDRENYLRDAAFSHRLVHWKTNDVNYYFQQPLGTWIWANGGILNYSPQKVTIGNWGGIRVADIKNGALKQLNSQLKRTPELMDVDRTVEVPLTVIKAQTQTNASTSQENFKLDNHNDVIFDTFVVMEDGSEVALATYSASPDSYSPVMTTEYVYDNSGNIVKDHAATPIWLTFMIAVEEEGTLTIGFENEVTTGFSAFTPFSVSEVLDATGIDDAGQPRFIEKSYLGYWSGSGDFRLSFTGKCSVYGLRLWSDMELQYATKIRQSDEYIRLEAQARNAMGDAYKSMLEVTAKQIQSIVATSDGRITTVKQTADGVSAEVADARGNNASLTLRLSGIESNVSTISGNVSSLQQTATSLTGYVGSYAAGATLAGDIATAAAAAQAAAEATAASDATSKMNSAISTAALDAKSKADAALGDAKDYADGLDTALRTFLTSGFVAAAGTGNTSFATMFSAAVSGDNNIVKQADISTFITATDAGDIISHATIRADQINLTGVVTFSMFDSSLQTSFNNKATKGSIGLSDLSSAAQATINTLNDQVSSLQQTASNLKAGAYWDDLADAVVNGKTFAAGGLISASMIDVDNLYAKRLAAVDGTIAGISITNDAMGSPNINTQSMSLSPNWFFLNGSEGTVVMAPVAGRPPVGGYTSVLYAKAKGFYPAINAEGCTLTNSVTPAIQAIGKVYVDGNLQVTGSILDANGNAFFVNTDTTYNQASSSAYGLIKVGFSESNSGSSSSRNYAVKLDSNGKAYVNVPWTDTDTNTTYSNGNGISLSGTTFSLSNSFSVSGSITASDFILSSDVRVKKIERMISLDVNDIAAARIVEFRYADGRDNELHGGVIAQDWEKPAPWAVRKGDDDMLGVCYSELAAVGIVALAREVVSLRKIIQGLEERMAS